MGDNGNGHNGNGKQRGNSKNLIPFVKGQSGNPNGRPRRADIRLAYLRWLKGAEIPDDPNSRAYVDAVAEAIGRKALAGDVKAAKEIRETTLGSRINIKQRTTILPVEHEVAIDRDSTLADLAAGSNGDSPIPGSNGNGRRRPTGG